MRGAAKAITGAVLLLALGLTGCSSSGSSTPKILNITFKSAAVTHNSLPALYTCDGKNIAPPVEWGTVPPATRELALFVLGLTPSGRPGRYSVHAEWAIAGIRPGLHRLAAGKLPPGVHIGQASNGKTHYSICPPRGSSKSYQFTLYAVPASVEVPRRFADAEALKALANPESATHANAGGAFVATYKRT